MVIVGPGEVAPTERAPQPVYLLGSGWVGPAGVGSGRYPEEHAQGAVPAFDLQAMLPAFDVHGLDPLSRFLLGAAARALADSGITPRGPLRERAGLLVGASSASTASADEFNRSIVERGLAQISAVAFSRLVLNAAAGICCQALSLRGPTTTLSIGQGSGLCAIVCAADRLARGQDADVLVAGGCDERSQAAPSSEGAACLVLGRPQGLQTARPRVRVAGWAMGRAGDYSATAATALARAGIAAAEVDCVHGDTAAPRVWGRPEECRLPDAPAAQSAFAAAAAYDQLCRGSARCALVGAGSGESASVALVLKREETT